MDEGPHQVVSGDDSDETVPSHHRDAVDVVLPHHLGRELEWGIGREEDGRARHRLSDVRFLEDPTQHLNVDARVFRKTEHHEVEESGHFRNSPSALQRPGRCPAD